MSVVIPILSAVASVLSAYAADGTGHAWFGVRPAFQSGRPDRVALFRADRAFARECGSRSSFQIVPFGSDSTGSEGLARWFMFGGKSELVAAGFDSFGSGASSIFNPGDLTHYNPEQRDINPIHFNIVKGVAGTLGGSDQSPFHSVIRFNPRYASVGAGFMWRKYFDVECFEHPFWFEISTALESVRTNMHLKEQIISPSGVNASNVRNSSMVEAFRGLKPLAIGNGDGTFDDPPITGEGWRYGKIDGKKKATKLSDIELKLGCELFSNCSDYAEGYIGIVVPIGKKPTAEFVFEPVVGQHQFGFMFGGAYGAQIYSCNELTCRLEVEYNARYLFSDTQMRSFDLKNKPWSRYQMVYLSPNASNPSGNFPATEGINIFTQPLKVTTGFAHILNTAFVTERCAMQWEVGYNLWARQAEHVRLKRPWQTGPGLVRVTVTSVGTPEEIILSDQTVDRTGMIGEIYPTNGLGAVATSTTVIQESDLDVGSAAHPATLSQTVYASFGYNWDRCDYPVMASIGTSYEFSQYNTALNRWMLWCKCGISL